MDDRKKRIDDLLRNSHETRNSLDSLLENFGETLYFRTKEMQTDFEDINQYNSYLLDISDSNVTIGKIEEKNRRFRELEDAIETKELQEKERSKELAVIYRRLGKALLENSSYADYTSLFKEQSDALNAKLQSLETRIGELDSKNGGNVFSWIGKNAQGLVLKTFLTKAQENQVQLYNNIGERYSNREFSHGTYSEAHRGGDDVSLICAEVEEIRNISHTAQGELSALKDEKRIISASFGIDGNPQKQIQAVKNHINQVKDILGKLYKKFGAQTAGIDEDITPERKYFIDTIVTAEDGEIISRAVRLNQALTDNDKAITKLRASLSIDEEKNKIEKFKKSIEDKKNKINDFQKIIADLEESVRDCEKSIQELQKQL